MSSSESVWERYQSILQLGYQKTKGNHELIVGACCVNNQPSSILFVYIASHSFISIKCEQRLGLESIPLQSIMVVTTIMKDNVESQGICENCSMSVNGRVNHIELIIPSFKKIHVVLDIFLWRLATNWYVSYIRSSS